MQNVGTKQPTVPRPVTRLRRGEILSRASVQFGVVEHHVGVEGCIGEQDALLELVDDDSGRWWLDTDSRIPDAVGYEGEVDVSVGLLHLGIVDFRMKSDPAEELAPRTSDAEEEEGNGGADGDVDAYRPRGQRIERESRLLSLTGLDAREDGGEDGSNPDERLERRDLPKAEHLAWGSDEVCYSVDDDGRETCVGDPCERKVSRNSSHEAA